MGLLDKKHLKEKVTEIYDSLDKMTRELMSPGCTDNKTGELRAKIYTILSRCGSELIEEIYNMK